MKLVGTDPPHPQSGQSCQQQGSSSGLLAGHVIVPLEPRAWRYYQRRPDGDPAMSADLISEPANVTGRRVILADDDVLLREGVASLLERSGFDVIGQVGHG